MDPHAACRVNSVLGTIRPGTRAAEWRDHDDDQGGIFGPEGSSVDALAHSPRCPPRSRAPTLRRGRIALRC